MFRFKHCTSQSQGNAFPEKIVWNKNVTEKYLFKTGIFNQNPRGFQKVCY